MRSVVVYYFSGTGNTEIVAKMIKDEFENLGYKLQLIKIEDVMTSNLKIETQEYDFVGIGCQVIGFGVPSLVKGFIKRLPPVHLKKTFIFRTAGGVGPVNYNASKPMMRKLKRKGYEVFHERVFSIGSNWCVGFSADVVKQLHEATVRKTAIMCKQIIAQENRILSTSTGLKVIMELLMPVSSRLLYLVGKDMVIGKGCKGCGNCVKMCPARNIYRKGNKIKFKLQCNSCMRCVYSCPEQAIGFRFLKFFPVPGGYNIRQILSQQSVDALRTNSKIPPFFNEYIGNDAL